MAGKNSVRDRGKGGVTIIIRKDEGEEPAHHGGAWKVAYADFVTAMMAFFLLMWLLNATTEEQRTGLADYFAPTNLFGRSASGSGQPFGGRTPNDTGSNVSTNGAPQVTRGQQAPQQQVEDDDAEIPARVPTPLNDGTQAADTYSGRPKRPEGRATTPVEGKGGEHALVQGGDFAAARLTPSEKPDPTALASGKASTGNAQPGTAPSGTAQAGNAAATGPGGPEATAATNAAAARDDAERERRALDQAGQQVMEAIRRDPALQDAAGQISVQAMPEGLRIQVVDAENRSMFALGSATPTARVRSLVQRITPALAGLPNVISIAGHTDALSFKGQEKGNWELSAERANATRRILVEAGLPEDRIRSVTGNADRDLLLPADPLNPANRRITLIVLRHAGPVAQGAKSP